MPPTPPGGSSSSKASSSSSLESCGARAERPPALPGIATVKAVWFVARCRLPGDRSGADRVQTACRSGAAQVQCDAAQEQHGCKAGADFCLARWASSPTCEASHASTSGGVCCSARASCRGVVKPRWCGSGLLRRPNGGAAVASPWAHAAGLGSQPQSHPQCVDSGGQGAKTALPFNGCGGTTSAHSARKALHALCCGRVSLSPPWSGG